MFFPMDFHHRKLLILKPDEEKIDYDPCDDDKCLYVTIQFSTPPPPPPPPLNHNTSSLLILMLCILGIGFVLVLYFSVVRYRSRNFTRTNTHPINFSRQDFIDENHGPIVDHPIWHIRTIGLQQSVIDSIAVFQFKKDDKLIEGSECSICLSEFEEDESLRLLPKCSHAFHITCIDTWLRSHQNCPVCRAPIITIVNPTQDEENLEENLSEESVEMENHEEEGENLVQSIDPSEEEIDYENTRKKNVRVKSDLASYGVQFDEEMEKVRRSISLDMNLTSMDKVLVEGEGSSSNKDEVELQKMKGNKNSSIYKLMKSSSLGRSLQKMPISMKRSFSSTTGKSSLSIHTSN